MNPSASTDVTSRNTLTRPGPDNTENAPPVFSCIRRWKMPPIIGIGSTRWNATGSSMPRAANRSTIEWYYWCYRDSPWMRLALAFIAGGAVGNLIDRVRPRYVADFIDVDIGAYQWPFFNLADMFICTGAGMLAAYIIRYRRQPEPEPEPADGET